MREFVVSKGALFCEVFDAGAIAGGEELGRSATWPARLLLYSCCPSLGLARANIP
jgi:hypothetical protein